MPSIDSQLDALPSGVWEALKRHRFDRKRFVALAGELASGAKLDNQVRGELETPRAGDWLPLPEVSSEEAVRLSALGAEALSRGQCALVVLAGGMATRMGGVVKALVEALPGRTFLDLRLNEQRALGDKHGVLPPLWLMTSHATHDTIQQALGSRIVVPDLALFPQCLFPRLTPSGELFLNAKGEPSLHAPGHGDLPEALQGSGLLEAFVARGGRVVVVTNLDNLGGGLDPLTIGFHLDHGAAVTSEVVDKLELDRGGIPVYVNRKLMVLEEFRLPSSFDPQKVPVFNTNVFYFDARALFEYKHEFTYFKVEKKVEGTAVVQFERLLNEVTSTLETRYLHVPRTGERSRFLPVKDHEELARRAREIERVAAHRGMV